LNPTPPKNDGVKVSWDDYYSQPDGKNETCSQPPASSWIINVYNGKTIYKWMIWWSILGNLHMAREWLIFKPNDMLSMVNIAKS
jgi:hypothetical protein